MFAAARLMPDEDVRSLWPHIRSIDEMARLFNVSESAMGIRMRSWGLNSGCQNRHTPRNTGYRYAHWRSRDPG